jgi:hypothetical protein
MADEPIESLSTSPVSPTPDAKKQPLSFGAALQAVVDGHKVTKQEWADESVYLVLLGERVHIMGGTHGDGKLHPFVMRDVDIVAHDWIVL